MNIIITLLAVGFLLYLLRYLPIDDGIKQIIRGVVIFLVIVYLIKVLGLLSYISAIFAPLR